MRLRVMCLHAYRKNTNPAVPSSSSNPLFCLLSAASCPSLFPDIVHRPVLILGSFFPLLSPGKGKGKERTTPRLPFHRYSYSPPFSVGQRPHLPPLALSVAAPCRDNQGGRVNRHGARPGQARPTVTTVSTVRTFPLVTPYFTTSQEMRPFPTGSLPRGSPHLVHQTTTVLDRQHDTAIHPRRIVCMQLLSSSAAQMACLRLGGRPVFWVDHCP